jgi:pilus assembly protein TadC
MVIIKKISGLFLFVLAILLSIGTFLNFLSVVLIKSSIEFQKDTAGGIGYLFGAILFTFLIILLIRFMFKSALKLLGKKQATKDSIEEIGKF